MRVVLQCRSELRKDPKFAVLRNSFRLSVCYPGLSIASNILKLGSA